MTPVLAHFRRWLVCNAVGGNRNRLWGWRRRSGLGSGAAVLWMRRQLHRTLPLDVSALPAASLGGSCAPASDRLGLDDLNLVGIDLPVGISSRITGSRVVGIRGGFARGGLFPLPAPEAETQLAHPLARDFRENAWNATHFAEGRTPGGPIRRAPRPHRAATNSRENQITRGRRTLGSGRLLGTSSSCSRREENTPVESRGAPGAQRQAQA